MFGPVSDDAAANGHMVGNDYPEGMIGMWDDVMERDEFADMDEVIFEAVRAATRRGCRFDGRTTVEAAMAMLRETSRDRLPFGDVDRLGFDAKDLEGFMRRHALGEHRAAMDGVIWDAIVRTSLATGYVFEATGFLKDAYELLEAESDGMLGFGPYDLWRFFGRHQHACVVLIVVRERWLHGWDGDDAPSRAEARRWGERIGEHISRLNPWVDVWHSVTQTGSDPLFVHPIWAPALDPEWVADMQAETADLMQREYGEPRGLSSEVWVRDLPTDEAEPLTLVEAVVRGGDGRKGDAGDHPGM